MIFFQIYQQVRWKGGKIQMCQGCSFFLSGLKQLKKHAQQFSCFKPLRKREHPQYVWVFILFQMHLLITLWKQAIIYLVQYPPIFYKLFSCMTWQHYFIWIHCFLYLVVRLDQSLLVPFSTCCEQNNIRQIWRRQRDSSDDGACK